ncbi:dipeptide/oligopeptide/nickel ABC transporter ATP-binding protein [Thermococcus chitonophagus]|uniref:Nickel import system ATP-binding protein NikD n=1 Tax=Thermococcus chitonophagus TaxID=54262 RepID=A0A161KAE6_9EURY|nr:ABC transporter ATP-binding protein [Thermococcus chitonophagus]ASJ17078.1 dipeptide/oligopeptide/nickel ABC transporter ATP-binding protein [Thermococcus chitonophagus]CUX77678.1 Oligopeptide transport ATP-binding protein OppD (TC 3.A.1.5.1) [Thermococcus chitonophagus]
MLLDVKDLSIHYYTLSGVVRAVEGVTFSIDKKEWVTFVGESGSGKSTVASAIIRLVPPPGKIVSGQIMLEGKELLKLSEEEMRQIRGKDISMVFQDPMTSLDPLRKIGDQLVEAMTVHGVDEDEAKERAKELLEKVNIPPDRLDYYPHQLSGGQRQRVSIAIAMAFNPKLLIADEPTTALDVIVQDSIMDLIQSLKEEGTSIFFVTHDISLAAERSDKIAVMYAGKLVEFGTVEQIVENPLHPYTQALLNSVPDLWTEKPIKAIPGYPPDLRNPPRGCRFHPRCHVFAEKGELKGLCDAEEPMMIEYEKGHFVACHLYGGSRNE